MPDWLKRPARYGWKIFLKGMDDQIGASAAQSAFFILMSVFPFLMLLLGLLKFAPVSQETLLYTVDNLLPEYLLPVVHQILQDIYSTSSSFVPLTVLATLWAASKAMHALQEGLDRICRAEKIRNWFVIRGWALLYTVVFAILLVLALIFMAAWHPLRRELLQLRPKGISLYVFATAIRAVYSIVLLTLGIAVMYKVFPHRKLRFLRQLPGAFFSAAAWYIFSMIVQLYVTKLKGFSTYGSLTTLMLVMFWLYFCCYFVMLGAEINEMLRRDGLLAKKKKKQVEKPASK